LGKNILYFLKKLQLLTIVVANICPMPVLGLGFRFQVTLQSEHCCPHFPDKKTEAERDESFACGDKTGMC
jgi:hypothetical protein